MKLLTAEQFRAVDQHTIINRPIKSIDLMEVAASRCVEWIEQQFDATHSFIVLCGKGNNGGDGLAITRLLSLQGYDITPYIVHFSTTSSEDFDENLLRLENLGISPKSIASKDDFPTIQPSVIIIDALLGTGLARPASGLVATLITYINQLPNTKIAIDLPSGMYVDQAHSPNDPILQVSYNLTFELPKFNSLIKEHGNDIGTQCILPIGLDKNYINTLPTTKELLTISNVGKHLKKREKHTHKGTYGHVCVVSGALGSYGATTLCTKASLKVGAGKCTAHVPQSGTTVLQISVPEAMVYQNSGNEQLAPLTTYDFFKDKTLAIGPGIGTATVTQEFLHGVLAATQHPVVLDADALNCLALQPKLWEVVPKNSILTPHPKEFERLVGTFSNTHEAVEKLTTLAKKQEVYILLKGATTFIACPDGYVYLNTIGNPGMATAGSGDVLTGILAGLLAQGLSPLEAVQLGTVLHGLAGNEASASQTEFGVIASDLIQHLPQAFKKMSIFV